MWLPVGITLSTLPVSADAQAAAAADAVDAAFRARLEALPPEERPFLLDMYANPLRNTAAFNAA